MTMVQSPYQTTKQLYAFLMEEGLEAEAEKVLDLYEKERNGTLSIGFAGHFSAGKSTLINFLANADILPSSPIPTSANIVSLRKGESRAIAYDERKRPIAEEPSRDMERLKELCKDSRLISSLLVMKPDVAFPEHVEVIDTPGVDSTDDMDRTITEGSMHIMDHLYYVVDYNHVQSEVNSGFLKEMEKKGIPYTLVINQMDKHREEEMSMETFTSSVQQWLQTYALAPDDVFYTTMHPEKGEGWKGNERLRAHVETNMGRQKGSDHIKRLAGEVEEGFRKKYEIDELEAERETFSDVLSAEEEWKKIERSFHERKERLSHLYKERVKGFLKNAYITPAVVRDDAEAYLEAMQPNFKKGLLFTKEKTKEERENRKRTFLDHFQSTLEQNLEWPLRDRLRELMEETKLTSDELEQEIQQFSVDVPETLLEDTIASGAGVTGAYVLRYMEDLSKKVLQLYQQEAERLFQGMKKQLDLQQERELSLFEGETAEAVKEKRVLDERIEERKEQWQVKISKLEEVLEGRITSYPEEWIDEAEEQRKEMSSTKPLEIEADQRLKAEEGEEGEQTDAFHAGDTWERSKAFLERIEEYEFLEAFHHALQSKRERLKERHYTIALFGAFSAGKSSFINALLGEDYLPTSPNPTTASINRVSPPDEEHGHESAVVTLYSEEELLQSFSFTGERTLRGVNNIDASQFEVRKRTMVEAFQEGFSLFEEELGTEKHIGKGEFSTYVSVERYSVFVKIIDFYVDSPYTKEGITFVDTPGADSVNDRHTDVSFNYIKEADAILFLTYYNHPFTKADARFLKQLGRVKDSFAIDKMFFLINASDLARSEEDLEDVRTYIQSQLQSYGVRQPRLYAVSSLLARQGEKPSSGFPAFEKAFDTFIHDELQAMVYQSMEQDMQEALALTEELLAYQNADEAEQEARRKRWKEEEKEIKELLNGEKDRNDVSVITEKIQKQFHYMKERQMLQLTDTFKEVVNPGRIQGNRHEVKEQLNESLEDLLKIYRSELQQECQAISLRMEKYMADKINEKRKNVKEKVKQLTDSRPFGSDEEVSDVATPSFTVSLPGAEALAISTGEYASTKQLFEANRKVELREEIEQMLPDLFEESLVPVEDQFREFYGEEYKKELFHIMEKMEDNVKDHYARLRESGATSLSSEELERLKNEMKDAH